MKKLFRRNQMVLTVLAVLVAIAGYITLTGNDPTVSSLKEGDEPVETLVVDGALDEQVAAENGTADVASESEEASQSVQMANPGEAVLTSGVTVADFCASARLSREQTRASNKETLLSIINSESLGDEEKEAAIDAMLTLTQNAEKENATETLLHAKGFDDAMVNIVDGRVNVVIAASSITEAEKAQIEDIVKQKTEMSVDEIVISLMELQE